MTSVSECMAVMLFTGLSSVNHLLCVQAGWKEWGLKGGEWGRPLGSKLSENNCIPFVTVSLTTLISLLPNSSCHSLLLVGK